MANPERPRRASALAPTPDWVAVVPYAVWTRAEDAERVELVVERYDDGGDAYALVLAGPWRAAAAAALRDAQPAPDGHDANDANDANEGRAAPDGHEDRRAHAAAWTGGLIVATPLPDVPHGWTLPRPARATVPEYAAFLVCPSHGPQRAGPTRAPLSDVPPAAPAASGAAGGRQRPWLPLRPPPPGEAALRRAVGAALRATVEGWQPALVALR